MIGVGSIFQSAVWTTRPAGVRMASAQLSGIEWATAMNSTSKGPIADPLALLDDLKRDIAARRARPAVAPPQARPRSRRVDRRAQARPKIGQRADMILVGVGDDDADEILLRPFDEIDGGHDQIDAGQLLAGETRRRDRPSAICAHSPGRSRRARNSCRFRPSRRGPRTRIRCRPPSKSGLPARAKRRKPPGAGHPAPAISRDRRSRSPRPRAPAQQQTAASVKPFEHALAPAGGVLDTDAPPKSGRAIEPGRTNAPRTPRPRAIGPALRRIARPAVRTVRQRRPRVRADPSVWPSHTRRRPARRWQLTPMPTTQARRWSGSETPSTRSPAHFASPQRRSFGHLSAKPAAPASPAARASATPATKPSCGAIAGGHGRIRRALAWRLPLGETQLRPRRPRPALCSPATIHRRPGSPASARRRASSLVELIVSNRRVRQGGAERSNLSAALKTATAPRPSPRRSAARART